MTQAFVAADNRLDLRDWTVGDLLEHAVQRAPDASALKQPEREGLPARAWTYAELLNDTMRLANVLSDNFRPGEHVALWGANSAPWIIYQLAIAQAGLVLVTLNPALRDREAAALLRQSRSVGLIVDPSYRGVDLFIIAKALKSELPSIRSILRIDEWEANLKASPSEARRVKVDPQDAAMLLYTSGTTGVPKGVLLHHRGIVNNAFLGSERFGLADRLAWFGALPLFHVGGSVMSTLGCISRLGSNIVVPAFEAGMALSLLEQEKVAWLPVVPTMVIAMIEHEAFSTTDLSHLQVVLTGGTIITPDFVRTVREHFHVDVQVMFGQTEAGGAMCLTYRDDAVETIAETVGRPYPRTAMRIADIHSSLTVKAGEIGEIRIQSPFMTRGYYDNPEATAAAFDAEGFLRTGDLGTLDAAGYLKVTGRLKEMIIRGGENIYPREIEDVLGEYPGIVEAAVVGVPHERWGEEVAVAIRHGADQVLDIEAVKAFLMGRLARHKVPKMWKLVAEFPRTPSGKIQKFEVISWFLAED